MAKEASARDTALRTGVLYLTIGGVTPALPLSVELPWSLQPSFLSQDFQTQKCQRWER